VAKYGGKIRSNLHMRREHWRQTYRVFKTESLSGAIGYGLKSMGQANRALLHRSG